MKCQLVFNGLYHISQKIELSILPLWESQNPYYMFCLTIEICEMQKEEKFSRMYLLPFPYLDFLGQNFYLKFSYRTTNHIVRILLIFNGNDSNSSSVDTVVLGLFLSQFYWYSIFCYGDSHSSSSRTLSSIVTYVDTASVWSVFQSFPVISLQVETYLARHVDKILRHKHVL